MFYVKLSLCSFWSRIEMEMRFLRNFRIQQAFYYQSEKMIIVKNYEKKNWKIFSLKNWNKFFQRPTLDVASNMKD